MAARVLRRQIRAGAVREQVHPVEAEVFPHGVHEPVHPGPYTFADAAQATAFVTEAVESLMYLGCDVFAE